LQPVLICIEQSIHMQK